MKNKQHSGTQGITVVDSSINGSSQNNRNSSTVKTLSGIITGALGKPLDKLSNQELVSLKDNIAKQAQAEGNSNLLRAEIKDVNIAVDEIIAARRDGRFDIFNRVGGIILLGLVLVRNQLSDNEIDTIETAENTLFASIAISQLTQLYYSFDTTKYDNLQNSLEKLQKEADKEKNEYAKIGLRREFADMSLECERIVKLLESSRLQNQKQPVAGSSPSGSSPDPVQIIIESLKEIQQVAGVVNTLGELRNIGAEKLGKASEDIDKSLGTIGENVISKELKDSVTSLKDKASRAQQTTQSMIAIQK